MAANPAISVIVPVYKVEEFLECCVDSILAQTFADFEILLVDDGSPDNSGALCDTLAMRDDRIRVFHKPNGGLSDARNFGVSHAQGDFIAFVDSDDVIHPRMLELLYGDIEQHGVQIACCDVVETTVMDVSVFDADTNEPSVRMSNAEALQGMLQSRIPRVWVPTKLYARAVFEMGFTLPVGRTFEDAYTIADLMALVDEVSYRSDGLYAYVHRENSITTASFSAKSFDMIDAWDHTAEVVQREFPQLASDAQFRCCWARAAILDKLILSGSKDFKDREGQMVDYLKRHFPSVKQHCGFSKARRLSLQLLMLSLPLYRAFLMHTRKPS